MVVIILVIRKMPVLSVLLMLSLISICNLFIYAQYILFALVFKWASRMIIEMFKPHSAFN